jgi:hypothetical protein
MAKPNQTLTPGGYHLCKAAFGVCLFKKENLLLVIFLLIQVPTCESLIKETFIQERYPWVLSAFRLDTEGQNRAC